jgi:hypothetical protein
MRTLLEMARAAQHDDRQATGKLYGDLADRIEALEAALREIIAVEVVDPWSACGTMQIKARAVLDQK